MTGLRKDYRVTKKTPLGQGGCAFVYKAIHTPSACAVAFKESYSDSYARRRMSREIQIQGSLSHKHVMPILDHDVNTNAKWFTMPLADGDLRSLEPMTLRDQIRMVDEVAQGLEVAHKLGHVHRDITPGNILQVTERSVSRFVVADWGLVRQPHGQTTGVLTSGSRFIGTQGFAAPEMYRDPHGAVASADVYSLGRVVAWLVTGKVPFMTESHLPDGPWRSFVRRTTESSSLARIQTMVELRALLAEVQEETPSPIAAAPELAKQARRGDRSASLALTQLGLDDGGNSELFLDYIISVNAQTLVTSRPTEASTLVSSMLHHLMNEWGHRNFGDASPALAWIFQVARAAETQDRQGLLEDSARALFEAEANWQRYEQRRDTRAWLLQLREVSAQTVARALRATPAAMTWYLAEGWKATTANSAIRDCLREQV